MRLGVPPPELVSIEPDRWTAPFWEAAAAHRLVCARCRRCGRFRMPPGPFCPGCRSQEVDWPQLTGLGTVYTYTVVTHAVLPALAASVPYGVAAVELDGAPGARLLGNVVGVDSGELAVGLAVRVEWADVAAGVSVPRFVRS